MQDDGRFDLDDVFPERPPHTPAPDDRRCPSRFGGQRCDLEAGHGEDHEHTTPTAAWHWNDTAADPVE